eukprot:3812657-Amphidinium_carterae.3
MILTRVLIVTLLWRLLQIKKDARLTAKEAKGHKFVTAFYGRPSAALAEANVLSLPLILHWPNKLVPTLHLLDNVQIYTLQDLQAASGSAVCAGKALPPRQRDSEHGVDAHSQGDAGLCVCVCLPAQSLRHIDLELGGCFAMTCLLASPSKQLIQKKT